MAKKKEMKVKGSDNQGNAIKVVFSSVIMSLALLMDILCIVRYPDHLEIVAGISLVFVLSVYVFTNSLLQMKLEDNHRKDELYDELFKSSKATYLMMRKNFDDIEEQLDLLEDKIGVPEEDIINAQKSIAKITISRNKENADAILNSNDKLLDKIFDFEDKLSELEGKLAANQKTVTEDIIKDLLIKNSELANLMRQIEIDLKKDIIAVSKNVSSSPVVMSAPIMPQQMQSMPQVTPVNNVMEDNNIEVPDFTEELSLEPEIALDDMVDDIDEMINEDPLIDFGEEIAGDDLSLGDIDLMADITADEELAMNVEEEPAVEEMVVEEPLIEEVVAEPEPEIVAEPEIEPVVEEASAAEAPVEEKPPMPDLSDPNHVMTPDEIAALLANTVEEPVAEEPVAEPEPVVEEAAVEEEKPAMPDLSDPNHVMTPDEIAALLANM